LDRGELANFAFVVNLETSTELGCDDGSDAVKSCQCALGKFVVLQEDA